jgi:hypothetical protein
MKSRRSFLKAAPILAAAPLPLNACNSESGSKLYQDAANDIWRPSAAFGGTIAVIRRELVRLACLAPSSHNTQCWQFGVAGSGSGSGRDSGILITPDLTRKLSEVDPDNHHLFVSLGCATENLLQASLAYGLKGEVRYENASPVIHINLDATRAVKSPLFDAIPERQCTRSIYDGVPLSSIDFRLLESAGTGSGVRVILLTERASMDKVLEYVVQANTEQMNDAKFVTELKQWIRFNSSDAVGTGDGLSTVASGNPSGPRWLGSLLFDLMVDAKSENDKYAKQVRSSAGIAVFLSEVNDHKHWIEVGRCYERFALQATALGIRNAFINQAVEVAAVREQFASFMGLNSGGVNNGRVDLIARFGRAAKMPRSLRRPVAEIMTVPV